MKNSLNMYNNIPMPSSININWNIGSMLATLLMIQIFSGFLISIHFSPYMEESFTSTISMSRDVWMGWLMRFMHMNMASFMFILLYWHIFKNMLMYSFKLTSTWNSGSMILMMMMMTAFLGYVLPWGQMSFWAATVITNLISTFPMYGKLLVNWLWGGFSVNSPTLSRFYSIHFIMPFLMSLMSLIHLAFLHKKGSSNPISITMDKDKINFHPFFSSKDILGIMMLLPMMMMFMLMYPFYSSDPENFIHANPLITPNHIQPEWYFLFAYSILRSIPNKLGGVLMLILSIMIIPTKSMSMKNKISFKFKKNTMKTMMLIMHTFLILTWIGTKSIEYPFQNLGIMYSMMYFIFMIML